MVDGKVDICCKFIHNTHGIIDIICKCSFECTYETGLELKDLERRLLHYICVEGGYEHSSSVESVKSLISSHHQKLLDELHDILYVEFMNSTQNEYYYNYYGELDVENTCLCFSLPSINESKTYSAHSDRYINARSDRAYMDIENDIQRVISKANVKVSELIWRAFDTVEDKLMYFLSRINVKCDQKFRSIIRHICRKVLICISNTLIVDLTMDCIFEYRMNVK